MPWILAPQLNRTECCPGRGEQHHRRRKVRSPVIPGLIWPQNDGICGLAANGPGRGGERAERRFMRNFARSLPQQDRAEPFPPPRKYEQYPPGFGGMLARMLATRNLNWMSSVRVLYAVSRGRVYWSAATVGLVGRGRKEVTPALVTVFAAALGIPACDLAAIGGMRLPADPEILLNPSADAIAELTWEARRLAAEQVKLVHGKAEAMRQR
jgi:hypothetical protein